jgi:hypothetical protein
MAPLPGPPDARSKLRRALGIGGAAFCVLVAVGVALLFLTLMSARNTGGAESPENDASKVAATGPLERQLRPRRQDAPRAIHPLETTGTRTACRDTGRSRGPARDPSRDRSSPPTRARHPPATLSSWALRAGEAFADQLSRGQVTQVGDRGETCLTHQRCSRSLRAEPSRADDSDTVTHGQPGQRARAPVARTRRKRGDASERSDRIVRGCAPAAVRSARWARR